MNLRDNKTWALGLVRVIKSYASEPVTMLFYYRVNTREQMFYFLNHFQALLGDMFKSEILKQKF